MKKIEESEESKPESGMDALDLAATREGLAIRKMNKYRVKKATSKSKVKPVG